MHRLESLCHQQKSIPLVPKLHLGTSLWPKLCLGKAKLGANLVPKRSLGTRDRLNPAGEKPCWGKKSWPASSRRSILIKLAFLLISPESWLGATQAFLGHYTLMMAIYLVLLVITGYFVFTRLDLIDVAVVMLFTSVLLGLSLHPLPGVDPPITGSNRQRRLSQVLAGVDHLGRHRGGGAV